MGPFGIYRSLRARLNATHTIPLFDGDQSRRHHSVPLWNLWLAAQTNRLRSRRRCGSVDTFVQFAGFPRSGHSLIGSILDAHPHARISHELDAMALLTKGFSHAAIYALIDRKSAEFTRHGRYWNGFSYLVGGGYHERGDDLRVLGDKKGDEAVRRIASDPGLLDRLNCEQRTAKKWILVLRNPFDNIATMSLRKGRAYDVIRTQTVDAAAFNAELERQQRDGVIATEALDSEIDEYASLCKTVAEIKRKTSTGRWFELRNEQLARDPAAAIEALLAFLGLAEDPAYVQNCARLVNPRPNRSRDLLDWPVEKRKIVETLIDEYSFLTGYSYDGD